MITKAQVTAARKSLSVNDSGIERTPFSEVFSALFKCAEQNSVSLARLVEADLDARIILNEADVASVSDTDVLGVWASATPQQRVTWCDRTQSLSGTMSFCSGVGITDAALVSAEDQDGKFRLFLANTCSSFHSFKSNVDGWQTPALAETATGSVSFLNHPATEVPAESNWYYARPGFWHGACRPAACWAGSAAGLIRCLRDLPSGSDFQEAALGSLICEESILWGAINTAAEKLNIEPNNYRQAQITAMTMRSVIYQSAGRILNCLSESVGPRPFVSDAKFNQRFMDVQLYLRQYHGQKDLRTLGSLR